MGQIDFAYSIGFNHIGNVVSECKRAISVGARKDIIVAGNSVTPNLSTVTEMITVDKKVRTKITPIDSSGIDLYIKSPQIKKIEFDVSDCRLSIFNINVDSTPMDSGDHSCTPIPNTFYPLILDVKPHADGYPLMFFVGKKNHATFWNRKIYSSRTSNSTGMNIVNWNKVIISHSVSESSLAEVVKKQVSKKLKLPVKVLVTEGNAFSRKIKPIASQDGQTFTLDVKKKELKATRITNLDKFWITVNAKNATIIRNDTTIGSALTFTVSRPKTINISSTPTKAAGNIDKLKFVVQKQSFIEIYIRFSAYKITQVIGLPDGMYLEGDYIKGSPEKSGIFNLQVISDTTIVMEPVLEVPNIDRKL